MIGALWEDFVKCKVTFIETKLNIIINSDAFSNSIEYFFSNKGSNSYKHIHTCLHLKIEKVAGVILPLKERLLPLNRTLSCAISIAWHLSFV